ncbi:hypothetical protein CLCR_07816 [Cladophialophora carrionii]|uniref:Uncharacterized protein n=1 Tax=Cladophialophora carrionii TaxID=86049 RepID=A0A1C1CP49_9EURO|nr:hypothetical protein CLCR_07816 [Cladophialophora carrionii]
MTAQGRKFGEEADPGVHGLPMPLWFWGLSRRFLAAFGNGMTGSQPRKRPSPLLSPEAPPSVSMSRQRLTVAGLGNAHPIAPSIIRV